MLERIVASMRQFGVVNAIKLALRSRFRFLFIAQKFNIFFVSISLFIIKFVHQSLYVIISNPACAVKEYLIKRIFF